MVKIDLDANTYVCPFCGITQVINRGFFCHENINYDYIKLHPEMEDCRFEFLTLKCNNANCNRTTITAVRLTDCYQVDILPKVVIKVYPEYIPAQIRNDYREASMVLEYSPKAAATLLRRCLQGMIHDFWGIREKNLNAEISSLKDKVSVIQWKALDGVRKVGNIGAHMESDVNLVIDVDPIEAHQLLKLIELLFDKWYIARHDEEELFNEINDISETKESLRADNRLKK